MSSVTATGTQMRSYYGRPILKEPTWTWEIPTYFFTGGLAGASAVLSTGAKLTGHEKLSKTALYVGAVADLVSPVLLISDLGRPERFHHMLRVVKVTSPMNIGSWVLLVSGGASNTAAVLELLGWLEPMKVAAEDASAGRIVPLPAVAASANRPRDARLKPSRYREAVALPRSSGWCSRLVCERQAILFDADRRRAAVLEGAE